MPLGMTFVAQALSSLLPSSRSASHIRFRSSPSARSSFSPSCGDSLSLRRTHCSTRSIFPLGSRSERFRRILEAGLESTSFILLAMEHLSRRRCSTQQTRMWEHLCAPDTFTARGWWAVKLTTASLSWNGRKASGPSSK